MKKYKSIETWQKAMQKDKSKVLWHDWFHIGGHWYTQEEYDHSGKYMRYTSVTAWQHIDIDTSNRYSDKWLSDMTATAYPIEMLRFDISYYIDSENTIAQLQALSDKLYDIGMSKEVKDLSDFIIKKLK